MLEGGTQRQMLESVVLVVIVDLIEGADGGGAYARSNCHICHDIFFPNCPKLKLQTTVYDKRGKERTEGR